MCTAGSRILVEEPVYDEFVERSAERAKRRTVGNPFDPTNEQGPQVEKERSLENSGPFFFFFLSVKVEGFFGGGGALPISYCYAARGNPSSPPPSPSQVDREQFEKVLGYIDAGKKDGARLLAGGGKAADKGYFIQVGRDSVAKPAQKNAKWSFLISSLSLSAPAHRLRRRPGRPQDLPRGDLRARAVHTEVQELGRGRAGGGGGRCCWKLLLLLLLFQLLLLLFQSLLLSLPFQLLLLSLPFQLLSQLFQQPLMLLLVPAMLFGLEPADILPPSSSRQVAERANNTNYGLAAALFTRDMDKAVYLSHALRAGTVWYGGKKKD